MPLSEHEQRILEDIERRLQEEDPRFAQQVARSSLHSHVARRLRWGGLLFLVGFVLLILFAVSVWLAIAGFGLMLAAALFVYNELRRISGDQARALGTSGRFSVPGLLARWSQRLRGEQPPSD